MNICVEIWRSRGLNLSLQRSEVGSRWAGEGRPRSVDGRQTSEDRDQCRRWHELRTHLRQWVRLTEMKR